MADADFLLLQTKLDDCAEMFVSIAQNTSVTGQAYTVGKP